MKVPAARLKERDAVLDRLREARDALAEQVGSYNAVVRDAWFELQAAAEAYASALDEAKAFADEVASDLAETIEARSDAWREGDAGQAAEEFKSAWEDYDPERPEFDEPVDAEEPDESAIEALEQLPEESGS